MQEIASSSSPSVEQSALGTSFALCAEGQWTVHHAFELERIVEKAELLSGTNGPMVIDVSQVVKLDTFGAWLIERLRRNLTQGGVEASILGLSPNYSSLVDEVQRTCLFPYLRLTIRTEA